ncbi:MAG: hypothetical protein AB9869_13010 [Verrucomicrobiia bacterium]
MKRNWVWTLLASLVLCVGVASSLWALSGCTRPPQGTAFLRGFSLTEVASKAGESEWHILEDRVYEPFPAMARSKRIARRVVAQSRLPNAELGRFVSEFQKAASATLDAHGARPTGKFELTEDTTTVIDSLPVRSRLDLPRRYYAIGDVHGVADIWCLAESDRVTVIVSLIEGM